MTHFLLRELPLPLSWLGVLEDMLQFLDSRVTLSSRYTPLQDPGTAALKESPECIHWKMDVITVLSISRSDVATEHGTAAAVDEVDHILDVNPMPDMLRRGHLLRYVPPRCAVARTRTKKPRGPIRFLPRFSSSCLLVIEFSSNAEWLITCHYL